MYETIMTDEIFCRGLPTRKCGIPLDSVRVYVPVLKRWLCGKCYREYREIIKDNRGENGSTLSGISTIDRKIKERGCHEQQRRRSDSDL
jgi:hypothetical protein